MLVYLLSLWDDVKKRIIRWQRDRAIRAYKRTKRR